MDGFTMLTRDHRVVEARFAQYDQTGDDAEAHEICAMLQAHAEAEELALYPTVREHLPDGAALAEQAEHEHAAVKSLIARVFEAPPADLRELMGEMRSLVETHVREEESAILPALRDAPDLDPVALGDALVAAGLEAQDPATPAS